MGQGKKSISKALKGGQRQLIQEWTGIRCGLCKLRQKFDKESTDNTLTESHPTH